jgi:tetratricopeptide (TPR) repeat protein
VNLALIGRTDEALTAYERARAIFQRLADENPGVVQFRCDLANCLAHIGAMKPKTGQPAEALAHYRASLAIAQHLVDANPAVTDFQRELEGSHAGIGGLLFDMGLATEALREYRASLTILQRLAADNPSATDFQGRLASIQNSIGWLLYASGRPNEALMEYERARMICESLPEAQGQSRTTRNSLANVLTNITDVVRLVRRLGEARTCCDQAIAMREALVMADPATDFYRRGLAESRLRSGQLSRSTGDIAGAAAEWRAAIALYEKLPPRSEEIALLEACCHASLSGVAGLTGSGVSMSDGSDEAERALAILRRAAADGYRAVDLIRTEAGLDPLRGHPRFQLLLLDAAFPADPFVQ